MKYYFSINNIMQEIIINSKNKEKHSNESYPEVTSIKWLLGELDENILKNFPNLTNLNCSFNTITDLSPLRHCTELIEFYCSHNKITNLNPLKYCTKLTTLWCSYNEITDLSPLQHCTRLTVLKCYSNQISDLSPLQHCIRLTSLCCNYNRITDLSPLQHCTLLINLYCWSNQIKNLEPLIYLRRLTDLSTFDNPLNPPSIQVTRFLERIDRNYNNKTIYNDTQNIHDVKVQQSVMDSVRNLIRDNTNLTLDIDSILISELKASTKSRLLEYFEEDKDEPHIILLITYKELFTYVWNRIINNPNKLELLKILDDNIQDSECKCFTGRFNRTLSTLVGFYDDIEINISDSSRISAIILNIKSTLNPYNPEKHKELALISLKEAGYEQTIIDLWLEAI